MKNLAIALVALVFATPAVAAAQDVAPAVKRKPAATSTAPVAPSQATPASTAPLAVQPAVPASAAPVARAMSERESYAALTAAAQGGSDAALDTSLIRVMSRLVAAGRCREAAGLAARDGRKELASRAQQLCK